MGIATITEQIGLMVFPFRPIGMTLTRFDKRTIQLMKSWILHDDISLYSQRFSPEEFHGIQQHNRQCPTLFEILV